MGALLGLLGVNETDHEFLSRLGQQVIYDGIAEYFQMHNAEVAQMEAMLVGSTTSEHTFKYKLPAGGYLQRRGSQAQAAAVKRTGEWTVSAPLEDYGAALLKDDITFARMTPVELESHVDTIRTQDVNTRRLEMLRLVFNSGSWVFDDDTGGLLTIRPLANQDGTIYPPTIGGGSEAQQNHYIVTNYLVSAISSTNNPLVTARRKLESYFGRRAGFANHAMLVNPDDLPKYEALPDFRPVEDINIRSGQDTDVPINLPNIPGRLAGRSNGVWVSEWDYIPANYALAFDPDAPKPLFKRLDPPNVRAALGLSEGITLVAQDNTYPLMSAQYRNRFGYGVGNRLNGIVYHFKASGSYDIPSGYAY